MSSTYEPIATTTLGSAQSSVTFSSISQSYTDLIIVVSAKASTGQGNIMLQVGNSSVDTGSNYSNTLLSGNGSSASSFRNSNVTFATIGEFTNTDFDIVIVNLMNYSNTTTNKTSLSRVNSVAYPRVSSWVSLWRSTSAINIMTIPAQTQNFVSGSTFTLYGIRSE